MGGQPAGIQKKDVTNVIGKEQRDCGNLKPCGRKTAYSLRSETEPAEGIYESHTQISLINADSSTSTLEIRNSILDIPAVSICRISRTPLFLRAYRGH